MTRLHTVPLLAVFACVLTLVGVTSAYGGFVSHDTPVIQTAERIVFTMNDDDTISAIVGLDFDGSADDFSWIVPLPAPPEIEPASSLTLYNLQRITNPSFTQPPNYCAGVVWYGGEFGNNNSDEAGAEGTVVIEEGEIGSFDYAVLNGESAVDITNWLTDNNYPISDAMQPIIDAYVDEGMYFVAIKLANDFDLGNIEPIKLTYRADTPSIPLRLTALSAQPDMPLYVWILADTPYAPENYLDAEADYSQITALSQLAFPWRGGNPIPAYDRQRVQFQNETAGQFFVTEVATQTADLLATNPELVNDPALTTLLEQFPYVTRLRSQLSPEQMTLDPSFVPDPDQADIPPAIDLNDHADPLHYWGCANRSLEVPNIENRLPTVERIDNAFEFRYPEGWIKSLLIYNDVAVEAYAPEAVTDETLSAYFLEGDSDFPIVLRLHHDPLESTPDVYQDILGLGADFQLADGLHVEVMSFNHLYTSTVNAEVIFALLTTTKDYDDNTFLYRQMARHIGSYLYYAHPDLRYVLAVDGDDLEILPERQVAPFIMGFPEGWTEHMSQPDVIRISPDDGRDMHITLRLTDPEQSVFDPDSPAYEDFARQFNLDPEILAEMLSGDGTSCEPSSVIVFEAGGRNGYLRSIYGWLLIIDSSGELFIENQATLLNIADSFRSGEPVCQDNVEDDI